MSIGATVTASITAEDTFTSWLQLSGKGEFTLSVSGIAGGTIVTLQRAQNPADASDIQSGEIEDVETYTSDTNPDKLGVDPAYRTFYRAGVKASEFGSGTVEIILRS